MPLYKVGAAAAVLAHRARPSGWGCQGPGDSSAAGSCMVGVSYMVELMQSLPGALGYLSTSRLVITKHTCSARHHTVHLPRFTIFPCNSGSICFCGMFFFMHPYMYMTITIIHLGPEHRMHTCNTPLSIVNRLLPRPILFLLLQSLLIIAILAWCMVGAILMYHCCHLLDPCSAQGGTLFGYVFVGGIQDVVVGPCCRAMLIKF